uniref:EF-hand domain-containing protein n=1 Tax=Eutreptiella gymnastica TaxID=73025 RepID=A0A7S1N2C3_9EUGL
MFLNVFVHELAHAQASISDEYSYAQTENSKLTLSNCHWSQTSEVPWQHWIDAKELESPTSICTYTNYFKPTEKRCLMGDSTATEHCAACAETTILAIMKRTTELSGPRCPRLDETMVVVANDEPWTMALKDTYFRGGIIRTRDPLTLTKYAWPAGTYSINHARVSGAVLPLRQDKGEILTRWEWPKTANSAGNVKDGTIDDPQTSITFTGNQLGIGLHTFTFSVIDNSDFVIKSAWAGNQRWGTAVDNMKQDLSFRVQVVSSTDARWRQCTFSNLKLYDSANYETYREAMSLNTCPTSVRSHAGASEVSAYYCSICDAGQICNDTFPSSPFEVQGDLESAFGEVEQKITTVVLPIVGGVVLFCVVAGICLAVWRRKKPGSVIPFPKVLVVGRLLLLVMQVISMLLSITVVIVALGMYDGLTIFGKTVAFVAIIFGVILFLVAFFGLLGTFSRSKVVLTIAGIFLVILACIFVAVTVVAFLLKININDESFVATLEESWTGQVKENSPVVCRFQAEFQCSGFRSNCMLGASSHCPADCEITNAKFSNPCWKLVKGQIGEYIDPAIAALLAVTFILLLVTALNWAQCGLLRQRKLQLDKRFHEKPDWADASAEKEAEWSQRKAANIIKALHPREKNLLQAEFEKQDRDGNGKLTAEELRSFYWHALEMDLTMEQAVAALRAADRNDDGSVDFNEFILMHSSSQEAKVKARQFNDPRVQKLGIPRQTLEQMWTVFAIADMDGSGGLQEDEVALVFKRVQGEAPDDDTLRKFIAKLDKDGSGTMDFFEVCILFQKCMKKPKETPARGPESAWK